MNRLMYATILFCGFTSSVIMAHTASAHILVTDSSKAIGAILHITPDDDPIAKQPATLFYDIQRDLSDVKPEMVKLNIKDESGKEVVVPITLNGSYVSAVYTFANRGTYILTLTIQSKERHLAFISTQRISRGDIGNGQQRSSGWAKIGVIIPLCSIALLVVLAFNHRKRIHEQTK